MLPELYTVLFWKAFSKFRNSKTRAYKYRYNVSKGCATYFLLVTLTMFLLDFNKWDSLITLEFIRVNSFDKWIFQFISLSRFLSLHDILLYITRLHSTKRVLWLVDSWSRAHIKLKCIRIGIQLRSCCLRADYNKQHLRMTKLKRARSIFSMRSRQLNWQGRTWEHCQFSGKIKSLI